MVTLFSEKQTVSESQNAPVATSSDELSLTPYLEHYLSALSKYSVNQSENAESAIRVSEVLGRIAFIYEKIRNTIEYKGEHVLRRNAIERILKRLLREYGQSEAIRISNTLLRELIWARYVKNDTIPKSRSKTIAGILNKYLYLLNTLLPKISALQQRFLRNWIWGIASCEIEETLDPINRESLVEFMRTWFNTYFTWHDDEIPDHEKQTQIYLAIHRALVKSDEEIMRYHMLITEVPDWKSADEAMVLQLVEKFESVYAEIENHLLFKDRFSLYRIMKRYVAPFEVLHQLIKESDGQIREILLNKLQFEEKISTICNTRYHLIKSKVKRGIVRSIIYIFITKVLFALLIEVPYELYQLGHLTYLPLGINVVIPPLLMWIVGLTIKVPDSRNTERILAKLKSVVYRENNPKPSIFTLKPPQRNTILNTIFAGVYILLFLIVVSIITRVLLVLEFTVIGLSIFFAFLSLVLLFGFRVKYTATELNITTDNPGLLGIFFEYLSVPFLRIGVYLSRGLAKINFFTVIFDFLIEAPLKTIIEVIEEWTSFIREKREDAIEVPDS